MTRLLLIHAPGMDWAGFETQAKAGSLPKLAMLRARGLAGWLSGGPPQSNIAAAASLVTGVQPEAHGVWRDREEWAGGLRPTGRASWRVAPLWKRLEAEGVSTGSVNWPATRPGRDWPGLHLDDSFADPSDPSPVTWALPPRCAPTDVRSEIRGLRAHPSEITPAAVAPFVSFDADASLEPTGNAVAGMIARAASIQAAAAWLLAGAVRGTPDAVFVSHTVLAQARHLSERPEQGPVKPCPSAAWRFLDGLVGRLAELAGDECLVVVASPGWRHAHGVVLAAGAGVERDPSFEGADILRIAPTLLARFGFKDPALPSGALGALAPARASVTITAPKVEPPSLDIALLDEAGRAGYAAPRGAPNAWRARGLAELALIMLERDPAGAARASEAALEMAPDDVLALLVKARAHVALGETEPLDTLADSLDRAAPGRGWAALVRGARHVLFDDVRSAVPWLRSAESEIEVETLLVVASLWIAASRMGDAIRVFKRMLALDPDNVAAEIGMAMGAAARRDFLEAEARLHRARDRAPGRPAIWLQLAQVYARSGRATEAKTMARTARRLGASPELAEAAEAGRLPP